MAASPRRPVSRDRTALAATLLALALWGGAVPRAQAQDMAGGSINSSFLLPDVTMGPPVAPLPTGTPTGAGGLCAYYANAQELSSDDSDFPPGNDIRPEPIDAESLATFHFRYIKNTDNKLEQRRNATGLLFLFNKLLWNPVGTQPMPVDLIVYPQGYTGFKGDFPFMLSPRPAGCDEFGCHFADNDATTLAFQVTLRGFLRVPAAWAGQYVNFAMYVDNSAGMALWQDKRSVKSPIGYYNNNPLGSLPRFAFSRRRSSATEAWRISNRVKFNEPGLFPVEFWFYQVGGVAALELSYKVGDLDFPNGLKKQAGRTDDRVMSSPPTVSFASLGFQPVTSDMFQQTTDGNDVVLFQNVRAQAGAKPTPQGLIAEARGACLQCPRQFADVQGKGNDVGCPEVPDGQAALYCNEAALCAPCGNSNTHCGRSCQTCTQDEFCAAAGDDYACKRCDDPANVGEVKCSSGAPCASDGTCEKLTECCVGQGTDAERCVAAGPDATCRTVRGGALCCQASAPGKLAPAPASRSTLWLGGAVALLLLALGTLRRRLR